MSRLGAPTNSLGRTTRPKEDARMRTALILLCSAVSLAPIEGVAAQDERKPAPLPDGFVDVAATVPGIRIELRYRTEDNFVGTRIDGYEANRCLATRETAVALAKVQAELESFGLGLKIFDAYRPQRAVDHFVRWAKDLADTRTRAEYYPHVAKEHLFPTYIARRSGHSRGSAVDVTLVSRDGEELDMGTPFDFFDPSSAAKHAGVPAAQRAHRLLLHAVMRSHGFKGYKGEWWHFSLVKEPFPETYFDFRIR